MASAAPVSQLKQLRLQAAAARRSFGLHASQVAGGGASGRPAGMPPLHTLGGGAHTQPLAGALVRLSSAHSTASNGSSAPRRRLVFRPPSFAVKGGGSLGLSRGAS